MTRMPARKHGGLRMTDDSNALRKAWGAQDDRRLQLPNSGSLHIEPGHAFANQAQNLIGDGVEHLRDVECGNRGLL